MKLILSGLAFARRLANSIIMNSNQDGSAR
jgi:hypothetical protein